ncbi:MAG: hypothetical protein JXR96_05185 [Deltaproteobacteria bacterium]|nr:hypothetical protein [Deltaproteobacteria bacterium]
MARLVPVVCLLIATGCSFGSGELECKEHARLVDGSCVCEEGYVVDPDDPRRCIEPGVVECDGHGQLVDGVCDCDAGYVVDPSDPESCVDPSTLECGGHGHIHDGQYCSCDAGYMQDPEDVFNCVPDPVYVCSGHGQLVDGACVCDEGYEQVPGDPTRCQQQGTQHIDGVAFDLELHLHADEVKIRLYSMQVISAAETEWDLYMAHDGPGPNLKLGPGVSAVNMGHESDYHAFDEAPEDGYLADDPENADFVIGTRFITGGSGETGFVMSEDVYALKLADGTFAKVEVLSARAGIIHVLCYWQPNGSRDIATRSQQAP